MKCDELRPTEIYARFAEEVYDDFGDSPQEQEYYRKEHADAAIAELKAENRKLKRALYTACANWADVVAFEKTEGIGYDNSVAERWRKMESKCRAKAEEYK